MIFVVFGCVTLVVDVAENRKNKQENHWFSPSSLLPLVY